MSEISGGNVHSILFWPELNPPTSVMMSCEEKDNLCNLKTRPRGVQSVFKEGHVYFRRNYQGPEATTDIFINCKRKYKCSFCELFLVVISGKKSVSESGQTCLYHHYRHVKSKLYKTHLFLDYLLVQHVKWAFFCSVLCCLNISKQHFLKGKCSSLGAIWRKYDYSKAGSVFFIMFFRLSWPANENLTILHISYPAF